MTNPPQRGAPVLLWMIALLSLAINIVIIAGLVIAIGAARAFAGSAADKLEALGNSTIATTVRVNREITVDTTVPFAYSDNIVIEQNLPIDTVVNIKQEVPVIGLIDFNVPIKTSVPINLKVPVSIKQSIPVKATVPINFDVPVAVQIRDTPLKAQIDEFVKVLRAVQ